ncbi:rhodanese-like domain-containing protein [Kitasatospora paracochleata]|uniref:Rhodanese-related sulfurtransferase n=1 Tax=Kitasatospora paracochleata TaxID=58354 RepID=A0ABT1J3T5_9ACTN|nr:rhodanese-like domain-containing protein [Kitasatospora paracochleata]MCP2312082.1 rhodanese-related sulfurtransferase [Kitasatospora paracochleata]
MTPTLTIDQLRADLDTLTVIDVRTPGEYAGGHVPGARNIPLDQLDRALPALRAAAERGALAVVCASGARSRAATERLVAAGVPAATVAGGTSAWAAAGHPLARPATGTAATTWAMDRQVRLAAGAIVLLGLVADLAVPGLRWLSAAIGAGLVLAALTDTCAMGALLSRLPHNRPRGGASALAGTLESLHTGHS